MKKIELFLFLIIILGAFFVRLYRIDNPIADWHAWRQADTSAVSRNFVKNGFDLLHPRFDDLSNVASGQDNPQGYRFVEFPIYNAVTAGFYKIFEGFTIEHWGRLVSIIASIGSLIFLFLLVRKYQGVRPALFTAFFFAFLPFNIYYSRTILPDTSMVMAILGGIYFFDRSIEEIQNSKFKIQNYLFFVLAIIFTAAAFLLKPYALFFTLPMVYLAYRRFGLSFIAKPQLWIFAIVTLIPLILWRKWIMQFPEGIPVSDWLFNAGNIRFKGAFFYWLFADRIGRLILGYWGLVLFGLGIIRKRGEKEGWFSLSFLLSSLVYLTVIAAGNVQHDYYQILIIPTLCIFLAKGAEFLFTVSKAYFSKISSLLLLVVSLLFMVIFSWYFVRDYFNINNPSMMVAGTAVDHLTPKDAKIIAPNTGDTSFLYQTKRQGWASLEKDLPDMIKMGAGYIVLLNPTENDRNGWGKQYKIVSSTPDYLLLELTENP